MIWLVIGIIVCCLAGAWSIWSYYQDNAALPAQADTGISNAAEEGIDEYVPSNKEQQRHVVAPSEPRYVRVPKISVDARIQSMGINSEGNIAAPRNIWDTGWYKNSAKPGESGTSFIDGHVNRPSLPGVFGRLHELKDGDEITVERGDSTIFAYRVDKVEVKKVTDINMADILGPHGSGQTLVLMTCAGELNQTEQTYDSRVIIYASAV